MQVKSMQQRPRQLASRRQQSTRTIAQRKRDLIAQIETVALSDLAQVSKRLKGLHRELEKQDGRRWTYYRLSEATGIPHRTWQSWENGEVENSSGEGYDKMGAFYTKKLGRKIDRDWILNGSRASEEKVDLSDALKDVEPDDQLNRIETKLDEVLDWISEQTAAASTQALVQDAEDDDRRPLPGEETGS